MPAPTPVSRIVVRMYRIGTGDCFALKFFKGKQKQPAFRMLIDCGSCRGDDAHFEPFLQDLADWLGRRLDLLVVTHEHLDHVNGFAKGADSLRRLRGRARLDGVDGGSERRRRRQGAERARHAAPGGCARARPARRLGEQSVARVAGGRARSARPRRRGPAPHGRRHSRAPVAVRVAARSALCRRPERAVEGDDVPQGDARAQDGPARARLSASRHAGAGAAWPRRDSGCSCSARRRTWPRSRSR